MVEQKSQNKNSSNYEKSFDYCSNYASRLWCHQTTQQALRFLFVCQKLSNTVNISKQNVVVAFPEEINCLKLFIMPKATKLHAKGKTTTIQKPCKAEKDGPDGVDPEETMRQFQLELCWCIQQLERSLNERKGNEKQCK